MPLGPSFLDFNQDFSRRPLPALQRTSNRGFTAESPRSFGCSDSGNARHDGKRCGRVKQPGQQCRWAAKKAEDAEEGWIPLRVCRSG